MIVIPVNGRSETIIVQGALHHKKLLRTDPLIQRQSKKGDKVGATTVRKAHRVWIGRISETRHGVYHRLTGIRRDSAFAG